MISNAAAADALRQVRALKQQVAGLERRLALAGGGGGSDLVFADDPPADTAQLWVDTNATPRQLRMFDPGLALPASDPDAWIVVADDSDRIAASIGTEDGALVGFGGAGSPVEIRPAAVSLYNPDYGGSASITNLTERLLDWNSEAYDHGGFHAANATNIVVPTGYAGVYNFAAIVKFTTCPAGAHEAYVRVRHYNASAVLQNDFSYGNKSPAGMNVAAGTGVLTGDVYLADGDYLTVSVWHNSGGSLTMQTGAATSRFSMHRVLAI